MFYFLAFDLSFFVLCYIGGRSGCRFLRWEPAVTAVVFVSTLVIPRFSIAPDYKFYE